MTNTHSNYYKKYLTAFLRRSWNTYPSTRLIEEPVCDVFRKTIFNHVFTRPFVCHIYITLLLL